MHHSSRHVAPRAVVQADYHCLLRPWHRFRQPQHTSILFLKAGCINVAYCTVCVLKRSMSQAYSTDRQVPVLIHRSSACSHYKASWNHPRWEIGNLCGWYHKVIKISKSQVTVPVSTCCYSHFRSVHTRLTRNFRLHAQKPLVQNQVPLTHILKGFG